MITETQIPFFLSASFITLTIVLLAILYVNLSRTNLNPIRVIAPILGWTTLISILSAFDFFKDYQSMPPRIPLFAGLQILGLLALVFSKNKAFVSIPQARLIGLQAFRIPVELLLSTLASHQLLPIEMTFHLSRGGRNLDIVTGIFAVFLGIKIRKEGELKNKNLILGFHLIGLVLLLNVVAYGMLSQPYPFKALTLSMDNFILSQFPITLLPMFLVPLALGLHLVSLRKALSQSIYLERSGAGLPWIQKVFVEKFLFPKIEKTFNWDQELARLEKEHQKILGLIENKIAVTMQTKTLVPPIPGLEDSSRFWSVDMTLEHLIISMTGFAKIIETLNQNQTIDLDLRIENIKPKNGFNPNWPDTYKKTAAQIFTHLGQLKFNPTSHATAKHPWFGLMGVKAWASLLTQHQRIHRLQIEAILIQNK